MQFLTKGKSWYLDAIAIVRADIVRIVGVLNDITYKRFAYYRDEIRDATQEGEDSKFLQAIDAYRTVVEALPDQPSQKSLQVLLGRDHDALEPAVDGFRDWIGASQRRIAEKRQALSMLVENTKTANSG